MRNRPGMAFKTKKRDKQWQQKLSPFCLSMFLVSQVPMAAYAQSAGSSYTGTGSPSGTFSAGSGTSTGPVVPDNTIGALATPAQGSITPSMLSALGNTVTNAAGQNLIIDVSSQSTPGTVVYSGTFNNAGNTYLVSSNPAITTATLQAASIYNQPGALITTILPSGGLPGFSNLISNLSLNLIATNLIANAGVISSAANLSVTAPQVVNALPAGVTAAAPIMSAINNLNIISPNIANAGVISSLNNINIATQVANNLLINNVGGVLSALNGAINVRDALFTGKYDFDLLGGDVLAKQLNVNNGDGILHMQVNNLTPALNVIAGEGYISALSDIHVSTLQYSGDPILSSGGDIVFQGDQVPPGSGNYTTICTGTGSFSGVNAYIDSAHPCTTISTGALILNLSGFANLAGADISSSTGVSITAGSGITTGNINAPSGVILKTSSGNISAGNLSANSNYIQLQADSGSISTGALSASSAVIVVAGKSFTAPSVASIGNGAVDIYVNQATPFMIGGAGANVGTLSVSGTIATEGSWIHVKNSGSGGITLANTSAININTPYQRSFLALDASTGTINLPAGTISLDSNLFAVPAGGIALSAGQINASGTTLSARNTAGGYAGFIALAASTINTGNGLDVHTDGALGFVGVDGLGALSITSTPAPPVDFLHINFDGTYLYPISMQGQSFTATSNGYQGQVIFNGSTMTLGSGNITLTANGTGTGSSGFVQLYANVLNNSANVLATANGAASDAGGLVQVRAAAPTSDLLLAPNKLTVSATGGPSGGNGGELDISAGRTLTIDSSLISSAALAGDGNGGRVTLVGGTSGFAGGGVVFSNSEALINANGSGNGAGGLVQLGGFGTDSSVVVPHVSADGGSGGVGGYIESRVNKDFTATSLSTKGGTSGGGIDIRPLYNLTVKQHVDVSGASGNGGGMALIYGSGNGSTGGGVATLGGRVNADGSATGGYIYIWNGSPPAGAALNAGTSATPVRISADGANGGYIELRTGGLNHFGTISASGSAGTGGQIYIDSSATTATGAVLATGTTTGGSISIQAQDVTLPAQVSVNGKSGGSIFINGLASVTGSSTGVVSANGSNGAGGDIHIIQQSTKGTMTINENIQANGGANDKGGNILIDADPFRSNSGTGITVTGQISANGGTGGGSIEIDAGGTINVPASTLTASAISSGDGGSITLLGTGTKTTITTTGNYSVDGKGASGNGGSLSIIAPTISLNSKSNEIFSANGSGNGNGGSVTLSATASSASLSIGGANGQAKVLATGGSTNSTSGDGGTVSLYAGKTLNIDGSGINVNSQGNATKAGTINLTAGTSLVFTSNNPVSASATGAGDGGSININAPSITAKNGASLIANAATTGNGGSIFIDPKSTGGLTLGTTSKSVNLTAQALGGTVSGNGGSITVESSSNVTLNPGTSLNVHARAANGDGGKIIANAGTTLTVNTSFDANGSGSGKGGEITLNAQNMVFGTGVVVAANGGATGNGGSIVLNSKGTTATTLTGVFTADSGIGGGNGGSFTVNASGSLTYDPTVASVAALGSDGDGGTIDVNVSTGTLQVTGSINTNGVGAGNGGKINLKSEGGLTVGSSLLPTSLVADGGATAGNGGSISATSTSGSVTLNCTTISASAQGPGDGGTITILAGTTILAGATDSSSAPVGSMSVSAHSTGSGGTVTLNAVSDVNLSISNLDLTSSGQLGNGGGFKITTQGNILVETGVKAYSNSLNGDGGTVNLATTGNSILVKGDINVEAVGKGNGGSIFLDPAEVTEIDGILNANGSRSADGIGGKIFQSGVGGGRVVYRGIEANGGYTGGDAGNVTLVSTNSYVQITGAINAYTYESGNGGNVVIDAKTFIDVQAINTSSGRDQGNGGSIQLRSDGNIKTHTLNASSTNNYSGYITIEANMNGLGTDPFIISNRATANGVNGSILADNPQVLTVPSENSQVKFSSGILVRDYGGGGIVVEKANLISALGFSLAASVGGALILDAGKPGNKTPISLPEGLSVTASTFPFTFNIGAAPDIILSCSQVSIGSFGLTNPVKIDTSSTTGSGGQVWISGNSLSIANANNLLINTSGTNGGDIIIRPANSIIVSVNRLSIDGETLPLEPGSPRLNAVILDNVQGDISLTTVAPSDIRIYSQASVGAGANISIMADSLGVGARDVVLETHSPFGTTGSINIRANTINLNTVGFSLDTTGGSTGNGGNVSIAAIAGKLTVAGDGVQNAFQIDTSGGSLGFLGIGGHAGDVSLDGGQGVIVGRDGLLLESTAPVFGANLEINAHDQDFLIEAPITVGTAGKITITANNITTSLLSEPGTAYLEAGTLEINSTGFVGQSDNRVLSKAGILSLHALSEENDKGTAFIQQVGNVYLQNVEVFRTFDLQSDSDILQVIQETASVKAFQATLSTARGDIGSAQQQVSVQADFTSFYAGGTGINDPKGNAFLKIIQRRPELVANIDGIASGQVDVEAGSDLQIIALTSIGDSIKVIAPEGKLFIRSFLLAASTIELGAATNIELDTGASIRAQEGVNLFAGRTWANLIHPPFPKNNNDSTSQLAIDTTGGLISIAPGGLETPVAPVYSTNNLLHVDSDPGHAIMIDGQPGGNVIFYGDNQVEVSPIAFVTGCLRNDFGNGAIFTKDEPSYCGIFDEDFQGSLTNNGIIADRGACLISSKTKTVIKLAGLGFVLLPKDSVLLLDVRKNMCAIQMVAGTRSRLTFLNDKFGSMDFFVGQEFVMNKQRINHRNGVGHRNNRSFVRGDFNIQISEVSIPSLLMENRLLRNIRTSNQEMHKTCLHRILKASATLSIVRNGQGPYYSSRD